MYPMPWARATGDPKAEPYLQGFQHKRNVSLDETYQKRRSVLVKGYYEFIKTVNVLSRISLPIIEALPFIFGKKLTIL